MMIVANPQEEDANKNGRSTNEVGTTSKARIHGRKALKNVGILAVRSKRRQRLKNKAQKADTEQDTCSTPPRSDKLATNDDSLTINTLPETPPSAERSPSQPAFTITPLTDLTDKDNVFIYNSEDHSLQDEASLADLSTIAGSIESLDPTFLDIPEDDSAAWTSEKDYSFKIIGSFLESRDGHERKNTRVSSPKASPVPHLVPVKLDVKLAEVEEKADTNETSSPESCRGDTCCAPSIDQKEAISSRSALASLVQTDSGCCAAAAQQGEGPLQKVSDGKGKKQVAFGEEFIRVFERSKEEIEGMMQQYTNPSPNVSVDLEEDFVRCITETTNDLAVHCADPAALNDTCITAQDSALGQEVEMREWDTSSFPDVDTSSIFTNMEHQTETKYENIDDTRPADHGTVKGQSEKWNQFMAHLEKVNLEADSQAPGGGSTADSRAGESKSKFMWHLDREVLKTFESGKSTMENFVGEVRSFMTKTGDGLRQITDDVGSTLACTATVVPDELIRCFDGQSRPADWVEPLAVESKGWIDNSWLSLHEGVSADVSRLTNPRECSRTFDSSPSLELNPLPPEVDTTVSTHQLEWD